MSLLQVTKSGVPVIGWRKYLYAWVGAFVAIFVLLWLSLPIWGPMLAIAVYMLGN